MAIKNIMAAEQTNREGNFLKLFSTQMLNRSTSARLPITLIINVKISTKKIIMSEKKIKKSNIAVQDDGFVFNTSVELEDYSVHEEYAEVCVIVDDESRWYRIPMEWLVEWNEDQEARSSQANQFGEFTWTKSHFETQLNYHTLEFLTDYLNDKQKFILC